MKKINLFLFSFILLFLLHYNSSYSQSDNFKWRFEDLGTDEYGQPIINLYLVIDGKEFIIEKETLQFHEEILQFDESELIEGESILSSCFGFWAGFGKRYYVTMDSKNNRYKVYYSEWTDGEFGENGPIEFLKYIE